MSPIVDTHAHWMVPSNVFPEMKESGAPPPRHAGKNVVATQDGVSIIVYEDF